MFEISTRKTSKIFRFFLFVKSPKLPKRGVKHLSISNIDRLKKNLEPSLPAPIRFPWSVLLIISEPAELICMPDVQAASTIEPQHILFRSFPHWAQGHMHLISVFGYFIRDSMYVHIYIFTYFAIAE